MKKTKIIIPAIGMLLLSTAASITGTVAWFSMNTTVTATGMTIKAKVTKCSCKLSMVLAFSSMVKTNQRQAINDVTSLAAANVVDDLDTDENDEQTIVAYDRSNVVWVTNHSVNPGSAAPSGDYIPIPVGSLSSYALINTFKIRLDPLAGEDVNAPDPLKVTSVTFDATTLAMTDPMRNAVSVLVESTEGTGETAVTHYQLFKQDNSGLAANVVYTGGFQEIAGPGKLTTSAFSDHSENGTTVKVYVFFDGDNQSAYTSNITPNGYTVELTFSVDY